jgi:putative phosphoesterase
VCDPIFITRLFGFRNPLYLGYESNTSESYKLHAIGLISDTHGLLRPEAVRALAGVRHIIHAGDIGGPEILAELSKIAPVHAVRGNNDKGAWAAEIPLYLALELEGVSIHVLHDVKEIDVYPKAAGVDVVIAGHSHKSDVSERDGVIFINPGSAGPRRFSLPVTVGYLDIATGGPQAQIKKIL